MDAFSPWPLAADRMGLDPGWVQLFCFRLDLPEAQLAALHGTLSPAETARAGRFLREPERRRFTAAHGQVREILGGLTGLPPAGLRFEQNPQGKPFLVQGEPHFNLSHSAELGLLAVAMGRELGVDLEWMDREIDYTNIARRFFAPAEITALEALPPDAQAQGFFNGWTRKEAYIKARGLGLAIPLDSFTVSLGPGDAPILDVPGWSLYAPQPAPGYTAALALAGTIDNLRCLRWECRA